MHIKYKPNTGEVLMHFDKSELPLVERIIYGLIEIADGEFRTQLCNIYHQVRVSHDNTEVH